MCRGHCWEWLCSLLLNEDLTSLIHCVQEHAIVLVGGQEKGETRMDALRGMNAELCW